MKSSPRVQIWLSDSRHARPTTATSDDSRKRYRTLEASRILVRNHRVRIIKTKLHAIKHSRDRRGKTAIPTLKPFIVIIPRGHKLGKLSMRPEGLQ